jgi:hypothetical protein
MGGKHLSGGPSNALVRIVLKFLERAKYTRLIGRWRPIAKHVKNPPANVRIGVVSHFQESIPNL